MLWNAVRVVLCRARSTQQEDISPDMVSFNTVLRTLAGEGQLSEATALYREMMARGHKANAATMAAVMTTAVAAGQPEVALGTWDGLVSSGLRPSPACANARLEALIQMVRSRVLDYRAAGYLLESSGRF